MEIEQIKKLLNRYFENRCSREERHNLERALFELSELDGIEVDDIARLEVWNELESILRKGRQAESKKFRYRLLKISAAAAICIFVAFYFFYPHGRRNSDDIVISSVEDISPGATRAVLVLDNGREILLDESTKGVITHASGNKISSNGSILQYEDDELTSSDNLSLTYHTIRTPKGGQFQIILPDGSKVWLNAATTISFPASFTGFNTRSIKLSGEAYFEIAKDYERPFIVNTVSQQVTVLGTHFNIQAYIDEPVVSTTLLEGSVKLFSTFAADSSLTLIPGQQAQFQNNQFRIHPANGDVVAWKDGKIKFENQPLPIIMRQLSRWYNVEIAFEGSNRDRKFTGVINRTYSLNTVLEILNGMGIKSALESRNGKPFLVVKN